MNCYEMANMMLGREADEAIPAELADRLRAVESMIHVVKPQGDFNSSQVVACMVEQWMRERREVVR